MREDIERGTIGSSFESFLQEQGTLEQTREQAVKRVLAFQLEAVMKDKAISKAELARRLQTSRAQIDRLLDPDNDGVKLATLTKAAHIVGRTIRLELM